MYFMDDDDVNVCFEKTVAKNPRPTKSVVSADGGARVKKGQIFQVSFAHKVKVLTADKTTLIVLTK